MVIALGVFVVVVGLILGSYFAITALPDMMAQRELDKRLKDVSFTDASGETEDTSVLRKMVEGPMPVLDKFVKDSKQGSGLSRLIEQSGVQTTPSGLMLVTLVSAAVVGLVTAVFVSKPYAAPIAACVGAMLPIGYVMNWRTRRFVPQAAPG